MSPAARKRGVQTAGQVWSLGKEGGEASQQGEGRLWGEKAFYGPRGSRAVQLTLGKSFIFSVARCLFL